MNTMDIKLRITADGRIRGLWSDDVQLGELGFVRVRRASHVEFDDRRQCWTVRDAAPQWTPNWLAQLMLGETTSRVLHQAPARASALAWEHDYFQPGGPGWRELS